MICLDCESTISSLSAIYNTKEADLYAFFDSVDLEQHCVLNRPPLSPDVELKRLLECEFGPQRSNVTRTYWFHLTRVPAETHFQEGVLPLNQALPRVWSMLEVALAGTRHAGRLPQMQSEGVQDFQYGFKTSDSLHWGPFGMLVRDIAFCAGIVGNHDYLKMPEIVADICNAYKMRFNEDIQAEVERRLHPTIVKFWTEGPEYDFAIGPAICYAYTKHHNKELYIHANTCFDGRGMTVPWERIQSVEQLSQREL